MYNLDSPQSVPSFCPYPEVTFHVARMSVVATCEGYLLIGCGFSQLNDFILLNPSTRTYREIRGRYYPRFSEYVEYGMCHCLDEFHDEYKIVQLVNFDNGMIGIKGVEMKVTVYNTKTNTWNWVEYKTIVDTFKTHSFNNSPALVRNHLLHLLFFNHGQHVPCDQIKRIGCFDMKTEQWSNDVPLPDVLWDENGFDFSLRGPYRLGELDNQLCFQGYNVIELKEYGVKESWVKLICLPVSSDLNSPPILGYRTCSPHEFLYMKGLHNVKLYWYNLSHGEIIEAEFSPPLNRRHKWDNYFPYICKESLLDFPGAQPITVTLKKLEEDEDKDEDEEDYDDD